MMLLPMPPVLVPMPPPMPPPVLVPPPQSLQPALTQPPQWQRDSGTARKRMIRTTRSR